MTEKERLSATVDTDLLQAARDAVATGKADNVSAWVNDALALKVALERRLSAYDAFLANYEAEHGEITSDEMDAAQRRARQRAVVVRGKRASA